MRSLGPISAAMRARSRPLSLIVATTTDSGVRSDPGRYWVQRRTSSIQLVRVVSSSPSAIIREGSRSTEAGRRANWDSSSQLVTQ